MTIFFVFFFGNQRKKKKETNIHEITTVYLSTAAVDGAEEKRIDIVKISRESKLTGTHEYHYITMHYHLLLVCAVEPLARIEASFQNVFLYAVFYSNYKLY